MSSPITNAIKQICDEKGLEEKVVLETVETALAAAYRKDFGGKNQNIKTNFNPETGGIRVFDVKVVVEDSLKEEWEKVRAEREKVQKEIEEAIARGENPKALQEKRKEEEAAKKAQEEVKTDEEQEKVKRFDPAGDISLADAKKIKKDAVLGDEIITELEIPSEFGRVAAQTAKQVIIQKLREAERINIFEDFKGKEGQLLSGVVQRRLGNDVLVDLGKTTGILPMEEQLQSERYNTGERVKVFVSSVAVGHKGPEIRLSRTHPEIIKILFTSEVPEIANNLIDIKSIAREAGARSKIAVESTQENLDPIGSCVGQRGARIQTIISELGGEKVDIIKYNEDPAKFVANSLSPAQVLEVQLDEKEHRAKVKVLESQLSLAIGKAGQNVRLAAKLTGWKIDIIGDKGAIASAEGEIKEEIGNKEMEKVSAQGGSPVGGENIEAQRQQETAITEPVEPQEEEKKPKTKKTKSTEPKEKKEKKKTKKE